MTRSYLRLLGAPLVLLAGAALLAAQPAAAKTRLEMADMPKFCMGEASGEFGGRPAEYSALPAERHDGGYVVYGQTPPDGSKALFFECSFNGNGVFQKVSSNRDERVAAGGGHGADHEKRTVVEVKDMARYCMGEASALFDVKPTHIETHDPKADKNGRHEVHGNYLGDNNTKVKFTCRFGPNNGFVDVSRN